jgi:D-alanyl-D-alanine carboxypeptidase (penicillin-binding protein 5/6)
MRRFAILLAFLIGTAPAHAEPFATEARNAILIDATSGAILMEKNADVAIPPASMSKLMTVTMVFEALASGRLSMDDEFVVSEKAWKKGGSKMFVKVGDRIKVSDLLRGIIVQSGNDACIVIAEGLAGSEAEFARRMTVRAKELGLENSTFRNATGWPDEGHEMSVKDLAHLADHIIREYPQFYPIYSERSFEWEGINQNNRNPLLGLGLGADGLKTGHTEAAGYGLVGSANDDGRRLILVIAGLSSGNDRSVEAERIIRWGFREFETKEVFNAGAEVGTAAVWIGAKPRVPLVVKDPVVMTTPFGALRKVTGEIVYSGPIEAPIEKGQEIATLRLSAPDVTAVEIPLAAGEAVARGGLQEKLKAGALYLAESALAALNPAPAPEGAAVE